MSAAGGWIAWTRRPRLPVPLPRPAGAAWLAWREQRTAYRIVLALAAVGALVALWVHGRLLPEVQEYATACGPAPGCDYPGEGPIPASVDLVLARAPWALRFLPVAVGALLGAPLFARDAEHDTHRLAWTQSVGRTEWAAARLTVAAAVTLAAAVLLTAPVSWWWRTIRQGRESGGRLGLAWQRTTPQSDWSFFEYTGSAGVAHLLLALLLGAAAGLVLRRTVAAVAAAAVATEAVQLGLGLLRPHLLPAHLRRSDAVDHPSDLPPNTWHLGGGYLHGHSGPYSRILTPPQLLPLQLIETGICLAAAAALAVFCLRCVRRISAQ